MFSDLQKQYNKLGVQEDISFPLLFIDGITRSGKGSLSKIVPSLSNMEHIQFSTPLEMIIPGLSLGHLSQDFAKSYLRIYFNEMTYNLQISRNVNFREQDQTGIYNYKTPQVYKDRLLLDEGKDIINICRKKHSYIPIQSHDLLVNLPYLNDLKLNYRMISLWRNPIDNIYSWVTRGLGERFKNMDPSVFTLLINNNNGDLFPWYCAKYVNDLKPVNDAEFCVHVALDLINRSIENIHTHRSNKEIKIIFFEDLFVNPKSVIQKICKFLQVSPSVATESAIYEANFPRKIGDAELLAKKLFFKKSINASTYDSLIELEKCYLNSRYDLI